MANKSYSILYQASETDPTWHKFQDVPAQSTTYAPTISVPTGAAAGRFFKVVTLQLP
jgi:hypothetical protein